MTGNGGMWQHGVKPNDVQELRGHVNSRYLQNILNRPYRMFVGGSVLFFVGICLPAFIRVLSQIGFFGGAWGGFGLFVIAGHLQPWIAGCGAIAVLVGLLTMHRDSN